MEVGPLSRMLVAYASGHKDVKTAVDGVLAKLEVGPEALFSTLGRIAARAIETQLIVHRLGAWLTDVTKWDPASWPTDAQGWGFEEAPRGALGHWVRIKDQAIENYQLVVPSTWNGSPRDAKGRRGAWEEALIGTPVADPNQPVEILRTIHSFDPCMACAVLVYDPEAASSVEIRVV